MNNKELKEKFQFRIALSKIEQETYTSKNTSISIKKSVIAACVCLFLTTGIVFAKDIEEFIKDKFGLGKGVTTSIEHGDIIEPKVTFIEKSMDLIDIKTSKVIDTITTKVSINSAVIVENNIGLEVYFEFDSKLNNYIDLGKLVNDNIDYENSHIINFKDLFVFDNENNIIFTSQKDTENIFKYCNEYNLNYDNIKVIESNISNSIKYIDNTNPGIIRLTLESTINLNKLPKITNLHILFGELSFIPKITSNQKNEFNLQSEQKFNFNIEIPEKIYNLDEETYEVISCESNEIEVIDAKVNNTGFHFAFTILNSKPSVYPTLLTEIEKEIPAGFISNTREEFVSHYGEEYTKLYEEYYENVYIIKYDGLNPFVPWIKKQEGCYVMNSKGEKFSKSTNQTVSIPSFENLPPNTYYDIYDMTKYDATDNITIVINFKNELIHIELEKRGY